VIEIIGIVENALAGIAGDDLIILEDFLEDLRPNPNLADFADFISGGGNSDSTPVFADALIARKQVVG
jgi:hypothetical protein